MIDINLLREENNFKIIERIKSKAPELDIQHFLLIDKNLREQKINVEALRAEKNSISRLTGKPSPEIIERSRQIDQLIKSFEVELEKTQVAWDAIFLRIPNIAEEDLPIGGKEANKVVQTDGKKRDFGFSPKNHMELNEKANWFDFKAGSKLAGSGFVVYNSFGFKVMTALIQLMLKNNSKAGFEPMLPPVIAYEGAFVANGSLPKFAGDYYELAQDKDTPIQSLIPTSEVALTGIFSGTTFSVDQLPFRRTAATSCFRKEAGTYGSTERGLIRIHQFEKVELYSITKPEQSSTELDFMVQTATKILNVLGLHYRVSLLATGDCSFVSARTYDIEVWMPGQQAYMEVSSCSNCTDFQSRRAKIRYTDSNGQSQLCHTLNASSLALPRLMVALMETYQNEDGSITLPKALQDQMDLLW